MNNHDRKRAEAMMKRKLTVALMSSNAQGPAKSTNGLSFREFMHTLRELAS